MQSQQQRDSTQSYAPSFRTRDSRLASNDQYIDRDQDFIANQRLLAEGYLNNNNNNQSLYDQSVPRYPTQSEETLAMNTLHNSYPRDEKRSLNSPTDRATSKHSHDSWCTCEEDHGHGHGNSDKKDPAKFDVEAQNEPMITPLPGREKPAGGPGGPGGPRGSKKEKNPFEVSLVQIFRVDEILS